MQLYMYPNVVWWCKCVQCMFLKSEVPYLILCGACIWSILHGEHMPVAEHATKFSDLYFVWMSLNNTSMYLVFLMQKYY